RTEGGSRCGLDPGGRVLWQKSFDAGETLTWDVSDRLIVVGATHHVLGFDSKGAPRFDVPAASVTCVAVSPDGSSIAFGTADGKLHLAGADGKETKTLEGADAKNPKPYVSAQFSFDNQALVALTAQEAHLVAGGQIVQRSGGIAGRVAPIRHGALIFLSDGNDKIIVL